MICAGIHGAGRKGIRKGIEIGAGWWRQVDFHGEPEIWADIEILCSGCSVRLMVCFASTDIVGLFKYRY